MQVPTLSSIPPSLITFGLIGLIHGAVFKANPKISAIAFATWALTDAIVFAVVNPLFKGDRGLRSAKIYTVTCTSVSVIAIIAMRRLNVIAHLGTGVLAGLCLLSLMGKIQLLEKIKIQQA